MCFKVFTYPTWILNILTRRVISGTNGRPRFCWSCCATRCRNSGMRARTALQWNSRFRCLWPTVATTSWRARSAVRRCRIWSGNIKKIYCTDVQISETTVKILIFTCVRVLSINIISFINSTWIQWFFINISIIFLTSTWFKNQDF